jgi:tRNA G18 (ribose-2'-O)-methylase SpoU
MCKRFYSYENIIFFQSIVIIAGNSSNQGRAMRKLLNAELNRKTIEEYRRTEKYPLVVILDNIRSLNNIGSVFRSCDAFLVESVCLCGITAVPPHREISKTALGATESVKWKYYSTTRKALEQYKAMNYKILAVEQTSGSAPLHLFRISTEEKYALIFGHEVHGVAQEIVDQCNATLEIPQHGTKHSLNVAVSAGIVLWEFFRFYQKDK